LGGGGLGAGGGSIASRAGHAKISGVRRKGNVVIVTLHCTASSDRTCHTTVTATQGGRKQGHATVTFSGGSTKRVRLHLRASAVAALSRHHRAAAMRITARTGSYRTSKTLR
jgi:hypothetical protein